MRPDQRAALETISWLSTGGRVLVLLAFIAVCAWKARRAGGGVWLLVAMAATDLGLIALTRVGDAWLRSSPAPSMAAMDAYFRLTALVNMGLTLVSIGLVVGAFALLRRPPKEP